jgi:hypothetical protein
MWTTARQAATKGASDHIYRFVYKAKQFGATSEEAFENADDIGGITMLYRQAKHMLVSGEHPVDDVVSNASSEERGRAGECTILESYRVFSTSLGA